MATANDFIMLKTAKNENHFFPYESYTVFFTGYYPGLFSKPQCPDGSIAGYIKDDV